MYLNCFLIDQHVQRNQPQLLLHAEIVLIVVGVVDGGITKFVVR